MYDGPAPGSTGWDEDPAGEPAPTPDWMTEEDWQAWCAARPEEDEPPAEDEPPPGFGDDLGAILAEAGQAAADAAAAEARVAGLGATAAMAAVAATVMGRRGPGLPGSAGLLPGEYSGPGGGFGTGQALDTAPGGPELLALAEKAAGDDDRFDGTGDDELLGIIGAVDRCEAFAASLKHAAVAALIRRRPAAGCEPQGPGDMPESWDEFTERELAAALAESRAAAGGLLDLAHALEVSLPGTKAAFRAGILSRYKAGLIAAATALLDPEEARAAEAAVLDRAGRLTPGGLRAAIARAVMEVNAAKARERREAAARRARVQRWAEASGNAALEGRELPPAQVLAADQRVTWWARQLREAGLAGSLDELRATAYLDLLLGTDSRAGQDTGAGQDPWADEGDTGDAGRDSAGGRHDAGTGQDTVSGRGPRARQAGTGDGQDGTATAGSAPADAGGAGNRADGPADGPAARPPAGVIPAGFAGTVNLTVPLATVLGLADRPGELGGLGPVDPWLGRDLAAAAAQNIRTTWCVTVTDQHGYAVGHGCARPEPGSHRRQQAGPGKPAAPPGPDPPGGLGNSSRTRTREGPGFGFAATSRPGPPGGYGTWRLRTPGGGPGLLVILEPISTEDCDHRYRASGHDPGVKLRHLTGIRYATCTAPGCRRPAATCDFEHNIPYEAGGLSCLCNGSPKCRHDHRLKQHPRWNAEQLPDGRFRWTAPSGRQYTTEPARYPI